MLSIGGVFQARRDRLHDVMAGHVARGAVPGLVSLVSRRGEVDVDVVGMKAIDSSDPMRRDTIFRISSMTKPIAAAAAMILVEEGTPRLDDPLDPWLPELAGRSVLRRLDGALADTVPANRPLSLRDLLTLRVGFGFIMGPSDAYPILAAVDALQLGMGPPKPATPHPPDEWLRRFATLPLMHQPGEQWMYEMGFALLGVLIARASGQPLETFLAERIFTPLGMKDTGFSVPASKLDRLATCYQDDPGTGALAIYDGVADSQWRHPPAFPDATGGLVSTVDDYWAFAQMMLNQGKLGSERILSRQSVETMTTDHLTPEQKAASGSIPVFLGERGWGFSVSIIPSGDDAAAGRYGCDGGLGTSWANDSKAEVIAILMTQHFPRSRRSRAIFRPRSTQRSTTKEPCTRWRTIGGLRRSYRAVPWPERAGARCPRHGRPPSGGPDRPLTRAVRAASSVTWRSPSLRSGLAHKASRPPRPADDLAQVDRLECRAPLARLPATVRALLLAQPSSAWLPRR